MPQYGRLPIHDQRRLARLTLVKLTSPSAYAERALRGVALGRNNFLFMGSDAGGERAAAMYSLVESAKLNGLDPEAYLRAVFKRIADHRVDRVHELLPWNIGRAEPLPQRQAA